MRRKTLLFVAAVALTSLIPAVPQAAAQVDEEKLAGVITGMTDTGSPPDPVVHREVCGSFTGVTILVSLTRVGPDGVREVRGAVEQDPEHEVEFCTRETLFAGDGRLSPTDADRQFRSRAAVERHNDGPEEPACIEVRLKGGEFNRVGTVAVATIELDVHTKRTDDPEACHEWDGVEGAEFREDRMCGVAVVTATPNPDALEQAIVAGIAEARRCPS